MKFLHFCRDKLKSEPGFSLLEIILVITISSLLAVLFLQLIFSLYKNNDFFNFQNAWQLEAYLALDFMAEQIKNSRQLEIINQREIDIFSYYNQDYQWLKFSLYHSSGNKKLGRAIGSKDLNNKDFGKNLSLLDNIQDINFIIAKPGLLKISLSLKQKEELVVSRLIKIN